VKQNGVLLEKNVKTYGLIRIWNDGSIVIGSESTLNSCWLNNKSGGGQTKLSLVTEKNGKISIGKNVGISNSTIYSSSQVTIEDNVWIGVNNVIYDTDFHSIYYDDRMNGNINIKSKPVIIEQGAWIGGHCIILKGVTIGAYSVIGAGSVVTQNVPAREVWGGNPAKFIKKI
jgi:acetyltransferase-like isoleucine patch superfamily enzyme